MGVGSGPQTIAQLKKDNTVRTKQPAGGQACGTACDVCLTEDNPKIIANSNQSIKGSLRMSIHHLLQAVQESIPGGIRPTKSKSAQNRAAQPKRYIQCPGRWFRFSKSLKISPPKTRIFCRNEQSEIAEIWFNIFMSILQTEKYSNIQVYKY